MLSHEEKVAQFQLRMKEKGVKTQRAVAKEDPEPTLTLTLTLIYDLNPRWTSAKAPSQRGRSTRSTPKRWRRLCAHTAFWMM
jgi:hypothetical protein